MKITNKQITQLRDSYETNKKDLKNLRNYIREYGMTNDGLSDVAESFEQGWNNAMEFVFFVLNLDINNEFTYEKLTAKEFRSLSPGDEIYIKVGEQYQCSTVISHPIINYDADDPNWEVETNNCWCDMDSVYKKI